MIITWRYRGIAVPLKCIRLQSLRILINANCLSALLGLDQSLGVCVSDERRERGAEEACVANCWWSYFVAQFVMLSRSAVSKGTRQSSLWHTVDTRETTLLRVADTRVTKGHQV